MLCSVRVRAVLCEALEPIHQRVSTQYSVLSVTGTLTRCEHLPLVFNFITSLVERSPVYCSARVQSPLRYRCHPRADLLGRPDGGRRGGCAALQVGSRVKVGAPHRRQARSRLGARRRGRSDRRRARHLRGVSRRRSWCRRRQGCRIGRQQRRVAS